MWRRSVVLLGLSQTTVLYRTADLDTLRDKIRVAKHRKHLERASKDIPRVSVVEGWSDEPTAPTRSSEYTDEEVADDIGMTDNPHAPVDLDELRKRKAMMTQMINYQQERRRMSRDAFLEWQAGQREKGMGERLRKLTGKAERFKRFQNNQAEGRLLPVTFHSPDGDNTSNDWNPHYKSLEYTRRDLKDGSKLRVRLGSPGGKPF